MFEIHLFWWNLCLSTRRSEICVQSYSLITDFSIKILCFSHIDMQFRHLFANKPNLERKTKKKRKSISTLRDMSFGLNLCSQFTHIQTGYNHPWCVWFGMILSPGKWEMNVARVTIRLVYYLQRWQTGSAIVQLCLLQNPFDLLCNVILYG